MTAEISEQHRLADPVGAHLVGQLHAALATLAEPWVVLASRRAAGADGPPWVRYIVLHPDKGIALVDTDDAGPAIAPLDDFLWHTGFAALQGDALCIVAVTITAETSDAVVDQINAAFGGSPRGLANPNWCEAVVDLLLATPDLMLRRLPPSAPAAAAAPSVVRHGGEVCEPSSEALPATALSAPARERWPAVSESVLPQATWRNWPISPVAAAMALLALGAVVLVARQASLPANETSGVRPAAVVASAAPSPAIVPSPSATAALPPLAAAPTSAPSIDVVSASAAPIRAAAVAPPKKVTPHATTKHTVRRPVTPPMPAAPSRQIASAKTTRAVCADVLHPDLPGGWQYRGPPIPECLPIRFFGLIDMR